MNEKDLGKALLRGEDPIDLKTLTDRVLRRDRRRMWFLGIACVFSWMLVVMLPWATILPMLAQIAKHMQEMDPNVTPTSTDQHRHILPLAEIVKKGTIATFIGSIASMFVAALCTVSLILLSRRATLRQLNARLLEISTQIKSISK